MTFTFRQSAALARVLLVARPSRRPLVTMEAPPPPAGLPYGELARTLEFAHGVRQAARVRVCGTARDVRVRRRPMGRTQSQRVLVAAHRLGHLAIARVAHAHTQPLGRPVPVSYTHLTLPTSDLV